MNFTALLLRFAFCINDPYHTLSSICQNNIIISDNIILRLVMQLHIYHKHCAVKGYNTVVDYTRKICFCEAMYKK